MATPSKSAGVLRFGVFEVDLRAGELRKDGLKVRLQEQPFRVLALLLEKPGEVITREEVREKLWSADTYVDFDKSLNTTVNKLREALGDSAENPRFVQTLHRRGYRFIAPVKGLTPAPVQTNRGSRAAWYVAAALAVAAIALAGAWFRGSGPAETVPKEPLQVVPLTSYPGLEGEPSFSPDGNQVAFSWNGEQQDNYDIYVTLVAGGGLARLTTNPGADRTPSWSPDGSSHRVLPHGGEPLGYLFGLSAGRAGAQTIGAERRAWAWDWRRGIPLLVTGRQTTGVCRSGGARRTSENQLALGRNWSAKTSHLAAEGFARGPLWCFLAGRTKPGNTPLSSPRSGQRLLGSGGWGRAQAAHFPESNDPRVGVDSRRQ